MKNKFNFWMMFGLMAELNQWWFKASADGKISLKEGIELAEKMCRLMDIEFDKTGVTIE